MTKDDKEMETERERDLMRGRGRERLKERQRQRQGLGRDSRHSTTKRNSDYAAKHTDSVTECFSYLSTNLVPPGQCHAQVFQCVEA